jgi:hypothetical protein
MKDDFSINEQIFKSADSCPHSNRALNSSTSLQPKAGGFVISAIEQHLLKLLFDNRYETQVWSGSRVFIPYSKNDSASVLGLNVGTNRFQNKHNHTDVLKQMYAWFQLNGIKCELRLPHTTRLGGLILNPLWLNRARALLRSTINNLDDVVSAIAKQVTAWVRTNWDKLDRAATWIRSTTSENLKRVIRPAFLDSVMAEVGPVKVSNANGCLRPWHGLSHVKAADMEDTFGKVNRYDIKACHVEVLRQMVHDPFNGRSIDEVRKDIANRGHGGKLATLVAINHPDMNRYDPDLNLLLELREHFDNLKFVRLATGHVKRNRGQRTFNQFTSAAEAVAVNCLFEACQRFNLKAQWIALKFDGIDTDLDIPDCVLALASELCAAKCGFRPTWTRK